MSSPNVRSESKHASGLRSAVMSQRSVPDARPRSRAGMPEDRQDGNTPDKRPRTTEHPRKSKGAHLERFGDDPLVYGLGPGARSSVWQDKRTITELQMAWEDHRVEFEASLQRVFANKGR